MWRPFTSVISELLSMIMQERINGGVYAADLWVKMGDVAEWCRGIQVVLEGLIRAPAVHNTIVANKARVSMTGARFIFVKYILTSAGTRSMMAEPALDQSRRVQLA